MEDINLARLKESKDLPKKVIELLDGHENIDRLSEKSILPHYRITNPETKQVKFVYDSSKVKEYIYNNCIQEIEGQKMTSITFLNSNKGYSDTDNLPQELETITNNVYEIPFSFVSIPSGIYFLYMRDELVYIGQSKYVGLRVSTHFMEGNKIFDKAYFMRVDINSLLEVEADLITKFKPKYNKVTTYKKRENAISKFRNKVR